MAPAPAIHPTSARTASRRGRRIGDEARHHRCDHFGSREKSGKGTTFSGVIQLRLPFVLGLRQPSLISISCRVVVVGLFSMKVLVLGATGSVGRHIVRLGIERGHELTALVRYPKKLKSWESRIDVVKGDALDKDAVERAVRGQEAAIYALGVRTLGRTTLFSESTRILIEALERNKAKRLVCITGVGAGDTKGHGGFLYDRILLPLITRRVYEDKDAQEALNPAKLARLDHCATCSVPRGSGVRKP